MADRLAVGLALLCCIACIAVSLAGCWPSTSSTDTDLCRENLRYLGGALLSAFSREELARMFAQEDHWEQVLAAYDERATRIDKGWWRDMIRGCPSSEMRGGDPYRVNRDLGLALKQDVLPALVPIIWDRAGNHRGAICVVFLDGHVETLSPAQWQELMSYLRQKGLRPSGRGDNN